MYKTIVISGSILLLVIIGYFALPKILTQNIINENELNKDQIALICNKIRQGEKHADLRNSRGYGGKPYDFASVMLCQRGQVSWHYQNNDPTGDLGTNYYDLDFNPITTCGAYSSLPESEKCKEYSYDSSTKCADATNEIVNKYCH